MILKGSSHKGVDVGPFPPGSLDLLFMVMLPGEQFDLATAILASRFF